MADSNKKIAQPIEILVAQNLPISNTGRVTLIVKPHGGGKEIIVPVNQSALLVPGDYLVLAERLLQIKPTPPGGGVLPPPFSEPIAHISYDRRLHHFNVKVIPERVPENAQFSVLVNLTDLAIIPTQ